MGIAAGEFSGVVSAVVGWVTTVYNGLVALRHRFRDAFAHIEVQLRRRHDLVPNLVETVTGYIAHERGTLDAVIATRSGAVQATQRAAAAPGRAETMRDLAQAE